MEKKKKIILNICFWIFIVFHILYACFWGDKKINYHVDEYYTYGLSNNQGSIWPEFKSGIAYSGDRVFLEYLAPDESKTFDYSIVWDNQTADVHPPLYYTIIHTVCSFFPNVFSKWEALGVNIALLIVVDLLVFSIAKMILGNRWGAFLTMVISGMTLLSINTILFLRMYMLMTVFVLSITALFLKYRKEKWNWKFYSMLFVLSIGGALTHYYFLIYLFFLCVVFGIMCMIKKRWKEILLFTLTLGGAGCVSVAIFPAMLEQIFGNGYRGQQAFENATRFSDVPEHIFKYFQIINNELFGGYIIIIALFATAYLMLFFTKQKKDYDELLQICIFLIPAVFYCVIIAIIAPYQYDRYIMAMGSLFVLASTWFVFRVIMEVCKKRKILLSNIFIVGIFLVMICSAMSLSDWMPEYTYQSTKQRLENADNYSDCHALYVNIAPWAVNDNMQELIKYQDYTFIDKEQLSGFIKNWNKEKFILYVPSNMNEEEIRSLLQTENIELTNTKLLYKNTHLDFASVYLVII